MWEGKCKTRFVFVCVWTSRRKSGKLRFRRLRTFSRFWLIGLTLEGGRVLTEPYLKDDLRARMKEDTSKTFAPSRNKKEGVKKESFMGLLWLIVFLGIWILLQAVILPKMGVST